MSKTHEVSDETLAALTPEQRDSLWQAYHLLNPLDFARFLYTLPNVSDEIKGALLRSRVSQPPAAQDDLLQKALNKATLRFWQGLGTLGAKR